MASIGRRNTNPIISSKDLKKAVVDANKRLKKSNDSLSSRIKDAEKLVKSKEKELKDFDKQLKAKLKEVDASEKYATKVKADIYSVEKESSKLNEVIKKLKGEESSRSKNVKKLESIKDELEDVIAGLEIRKQKADKIVKDIGNIEVRQSVAQSDLNKIFRTQEKIEEEVEDAKEHYEKVKKNTKVKEKSLREKIDTLELSVASLEDISSQEQEKADGVLRVIKEEIKHKSAELEAVNSLVNKAEDEYIAWQRKIENAKKDVEIEGRKVQTVKDAYETWRINRLEAEAKLKLKKKIDNIDKAGLMEILGNG